MFCVSSLGVWWRHDIRIPEKLKVNYLKNEKSYWSEIKNIFLCFTSTLAKQTSKNVADTTFKFEGSSCQRLSQYQGLLFRPIGKLYIWCRSTVLYLRSTHILNILFKYSFVNILLKRSIIIRAEAATRGVL